MAASWSAGRSAEARTIRAATCRGLRRYRTACRLVNDFDYTRGVFRRFAGPITHVARAGAVAVAALSAACSAPTGPSVITVERARYAEAFDAAVEAVYAVGMTTAVRDREGGFIETETRHAGTLLEPWRQDNSGFSQGAQNTLAPRRRRVRFEFVPVGTEVPAPSAQEVLRGPDLDAARGAAARPLTGPGGPLELRVWVYLEQSFTPNVRRFLWTRQLTTQAFEVEEPPDYAESVEPTSLWTPIGRDEPYERRLMGDVVKRLGLAATESGDPPSDTPHPPPG